MRSAAPNTNSPFRTRPKHVKLSPCPIGISPQHSTNSLDANVARRGVLQQSGTFEWPKKAQNGHGWLKSTIFQYYTKHRFIYILVPILSLGSVGLYIMCFGTIAG